MALAAGSMGIRFLLIPKIADLAKLLPAMIIGLALAEGIGILGMFAISKDLPETQIAPFRDIRLRGAELCAVLCALPRGAAENALNSEC